MSDTRWLLYGATGYTGRLIAAEAVRRGHHPILAGRSSEKLAPLAASLGLGHVVFSLDDLTGVARSISSSGVKLVLHAAGPFMQTASPMLRACVVTQTHYLDITGEYPVLANTLTYDQSARRLNIAFISGVGFDVVPSDCLAAYIARNVPNADTLAIAIAGVRGLSTGTARSGMALAASGGVIRQDGTLMHLPLGSGGHIIPFPRNKRYAIPIPWGDLVTAYHSTGIPNITTYMTVPRPLATGARILLPLAQPFLSSVHFQNLVAGMLPKPHSEGRAFVWARVKNTDRQSAEAWLETPEPYTFTALSAVRAVERVFADQVVGALTPSQAFGTEFPLELADTRRIE